MGVVAAERARPRARTARRRRVPFKTGWLLWLGVVLIMLFCLFPFYWLINTSLKTGADLSSANVVPPHPNLDNYQSIFQNADFVKALRNSAIISGITTLIALTIGSFAAYALARLRFPMKFLLLAVVLSITTFPPIAIAAPVFKLWTDLGLYNTYLGLILPDLTFTLPLTIYILTSFFREIPRELEEAALVDGARPLTLVTRVFLPLLWPALATTGLLAFIAAWNELLFALTFVLSDERRTVPVAIALISGASQFELPWGRVMAASVIVTVPLVLLVLVLQRRIVAGLTAGAVKG
jgi:multiple sugar transport system permease protein